MFNIREQVAKESKEAMDCLRQIMPLNETMENIVIGNSTNGSLQKTMTTNDFLCFKLLGQHYFDLATGTGPAVATGFFNACASRLGMKVVIDVKLLQSEKISDQETNKIAQFVKKLAREINQKFPDKVPAVAAILNAEWEPDSDTASTISVAVPPRPALRSATAGPVTAPVAPPRKMPSAAELPVPPLPSSAAGLPTSSSAPKKTAREYVIDEIITTEKNYVADLALIEEKFIIPLRENKLISDNESKTLFSNIQSLLPIHRMLLAGLTRPNARIGDAFIDGNLVDTFKIYALYCSRDPSLCTDLVNKHPKFGAFLLEKQKDPACKNGTLDSYLIKPIQRICKYPLLLQELIKNTPPDHAEYDKLAAALEKVKGVATIVNEKTADIQSRQQVAEIQNSLDQKLDLISPSRRLIRQDDVMEWSYKKNGWSQRRYFLFNDLIIITKRKEKILTKKIEHVETIPLERVVIRSCDNMEAAFEIVPVPYSAHLLIAESDWEKGNDAVRQAWLSTAPSLINDVIHQKEQEWENLNNLASTGVGEDASADSASESNNSVSSGGGGGGGGNSHSNNHLSASPPEVLQLKKGTLTPDGKGAAFSSDLLRGVTNRKRLSGMPRLPAKEEISDGAEESGSNYYGHSVTMARCLFSFETNNEGDLNFQEGDVIVILSKNLPNDPGWWRGRATKEPYSEGLFPPNYVVEISSNSSGGSSGSSSSILNVTPAPVSPATVQQQQLPPPPSLSSVVPSTPTDPPPSSTTSTTTATIATAAPTPVPRQSRTAAATAVKYAVAEALYEYQAQSSAEISFKSGDSLHVLDASSSPVWWTAEVPATSARGLVPSSYVKIIENSAGLEIAVPPEAKYSTIAKQLMSSGKNASKRFSDASTASNDSSGSSNSNDTHYQKPALQPPQLQAAAAAAAADAAPVKPLRTNASAVGFTVKPVGTNDKGAPRINAAAASGGAELALVKAEVDRERKLRVQVEAENARLKEEIARMKEDKASDDKIQTDLQSAISSLQATLDLLKEDIVLEKKKNSQLQEALRAAAPPSAPSSAPAGAAAATTATTTTMNAGHLATLSTRTRNHSGGGPTPPPPPSTLKPHPQQPQQSPLGVRSLSGTFAATSSSLLTTNTLAATPSAEAATAPVSSTGGGFFIKHPVASASLEQSLRSSQQVRKSLTASGKSSSNGDFFRESIMAKPDDTLTHSLPSSAASASTTASINSSAAATAATPAPARPASTTSSAVKERMKMFQK